MLEVPVGLFCFELLYADGADLTQLPYPQRRAALARAITVTDRLQLTTTTEVSDPAALDAAFEQAVTDGCEGLVCKSIGPGSVYQAGARGWQWIKLKRDYRTELSDTVHLVVVGAFAGRGRRAAAAASAATARAWLTTANTGRLAREPQEPPTEASWLAPAPATRPWGRFGARFHGRRSGTG
jgi:DNA ligase 1